MCLRVCLWNRQWHNYQYMVSHEGNRPLSSPPAKQMNSVSLQASYPGTEETDRQDKCEYAPSTDQKVDLWYKLKTLWMFFLQFHHSLPKCSAHTSSSLKPPPAGAPRHCNHITGKKRLKPQKPLKPFLVVNCTLWQTWHTSCYCKPLCAPSDEHI